LGPARKKGRDGQLHGCQRNSRNQAGHGPGLHDDGMAVGCTVLQAGPCVVVQRRTKEKDGYDAAQLGLVEFIKPQRVTKPMLGHFKKSDAAPMRRLGEVRLDDSADETKAGDRVLVDRFQPASWWTLPASPRGRDLLARSSDGISVEAMRRTVPCTIVRPAALGEFVSVARLARATFSGAHGESPLNGKKPPRRESGHRRKICFWCTARCQVRWEHT